MKRVILYFMAAVLLLTSCTDKEVYTGSKNEAVSFEEKVISFENADNLEVNIDYCNIDVYTWDKKEIKFEIIKKLRDNIEVEKLEKTMKDFKISLTKKKQDIIFDLYYKGKVRQTADRNLEVKLFVPRQLNCLSIRIDEGTIRTLDDIDCDLSIENKTANYYINCFSGRLSYKGEMGNLNISSGKLKKGSYASSEMGNISIRADFEQNTNYIFESDRGNIVLQLPEKLQASVECIGNVTVNEFEDNLSNTKISLYSRGGKISARKYVQQ